MNDWITYGVTASRDRLAEYREPGPFATDIQIICQRVMKGVLETSAIYMFPGCVFSEWLVDNDILHHYEWVPHYQEFGPDEPGWQAIYVLHVYRPEDAVAMRIRFNILPMAEDWREQWDARGFDWYMKT